MNSVIFRYVFVALLLCSDWTKAEPIDVDPLPSWNDTGPKQAIRSFVARVTAKEGQLAFVKA